MKRWILVVLFLLLSSILINAEEDVKVDNEVEELIKKEGEADVIVVLKDEVEEGFFIKSKKEVDKEEVISQFSENELDEGYRYESFNGFSGKVSKEGLEKLKARDDVETIFYDSILHISMQDSLPLINATVAHNSRINGINLTGKGETICVIDTGINYTHESFGGCDVTSDINEANCERVVGGYDYVNNDADPYDDNNHGTHVSGIAAGNGAIIGVAPEAKIIAIKACNHLGECPTSAISAGIDWCVGNRTEYNISIITMSLGDGGSYNEDNCWASAISAMDASVDVAFAAGIFLAAAAGNNAPLNSGISHPACLNNVTGVGAVDKSDNIDYKRGELLSLLAPGININSTHLFGVAAEMSGTSMATPHVAGAAALLLQYVKEERSVILNQSEIEEALNNTGKRIYDGSTGLSFSRIDVLKALIYLDELSPSLVLEEPRNITYSSNESLELNFSSSDTFLDSTWYNIDNGENVSLSENIRFNISEGNHVISVYNNDSNGNENYSSVSFIAGGVASVSSEALSVTLESPVDFFNDTDGNVELNCSASDDVNLSNMTLYHNLTGSFEANLTVEVSETSNSSVFNITEIDDNVQFIWSCEASDVDNNSTFASENRTVIIRINDAPIIQEFTPNSSSVSINENTAQEFKHVTTDEDSDVLIYSWKLDWSEKASSENYSYTPAYSVASGSNVEQNLTLEVKDGEFTINNYWNLTINDVIVCGNNIKEGSEEECDGSDNSACSASETCDSGCICQSSSSSDDGGGGGEDSGGGGEESVSTECVEVWECSSWSLCRDPGIRTRTCSETGGCGTTEDKPAEEETCEYAPINTTEETIEEITILEASSEGIEGEDLSEVTGSVARVTDFIKSNRLTSGIIGGSIAILVLLGILWQQGGLGVVLSYGNNIGSGLKGLGGKASDLGREVWEDSKRFIKEARSMGVEAEHKIAEKGKRVEKKAAERLRERMHPETYHDFELKIEKKRFK